MFLGSFIESLVFLGISIESVVFLGIFIESVVFLGEGVAGAQRGGRHAAGVRPAVWQCNSGPWPLRPAVPTSERPRTDVAPSVFYNRHKLGKPKRLTQPLSAF